MGIKGVKIKVLGSGSFGVVHLVKTTNPTLQFLAIKSADEINSSSLVKEQEILLKFTGSPNIVRCFGGFASIEDETSHYNMILEYAPGGSLLDLIKKYGGKIPEQDVKFYTRMILEGLVEIHRKGYVHCDLKPDNILVFPSKDGTSLPTLKIADFGLARRCDVEDPRAGIFGFRGTGLYMSPESIVGNISGALDVWSLGCIVVEMITGRRPWGGDDVMGLMEKLLKGESPKIPENMSIAGMFFLMKCFDMDPTQRWTARLLLSHSFLTPSRTLFPNRFLASTNFSQDNNLARKNQFCGQVDMVQSALKRQELWH